MKRVVPKKALGQNFLIDRNIAEKIVREFDPKPGEVVVEIGPGEGALTELLIDSGCTLVAIELDPEAATAIRNRFGDRLELIEKDVLQVDLPELAQRFQAERLRVIGNIPYYITSPILFHLIDARSAVADAMMMMQKEVAERLVAVPRTKDYGILAVVAQTFTRPRRLFDVGPKCFYPPPRVTSAVVRFTFSDMEGIRGCEEWHRRLVRTAFNQRRKTLRNSLSQLLSNPKDRDEIFEQAGITPTKRAEELPPVEFIRFARVLQNAFPGGERDTET